MAEVSGSIRSGVHTFWSFKTLRTHRNLSTVDSRLSCPCPDEFINTASLATRTGSGLSAEVVTCINSCAAVTVCADWTRARQKQQISGYGAFLLPLEKHYRLPGTRAYCCGTARETPCPLYRSRSAYYDILKVSPNATQAQIKSAYYKQSFINHPDRNRSEEAARLFALVAEAYSVLGNSSLRRKYDRGILNHGRHGSIQTAGRPSSCSHAPDLQHRRPRRDALFDFDAFYRAHYGEQLEKEKQMKHRREQLRQQQQEKLKEWKQMKMTEVTVAFLLLLGGVVLISLRT